MADHFGNYRVESFLGKGGMGQVFRGKHRFFDEPDVAIKVLYPHLSAEPDSQARFLQEARSARSLVHPNIVKVIDFGEQDGVFYLLMELMTGGSLRNLLMRETGAGRPLSLNTGVDIVRQTAEGLAYAHDRGIIHRDIKPDNLLLSECGAGAYTVKIADFGLVKMAEGGVRTISRSRIGTPAYMSPEQCQGLKMDARSDLYSLGIVLYEAVTGYLPFEIKTPVEALHKHIYVAPTPPRVVRVDILEELERIILKCLAKSPHERYSSAVELLADLNQLQLVGEEQTIRIADPPKTPPPNNTATQSGPPSSVGAVESHRDAPPAPAAAMRIGISPARAGGRTRATYRVELRNDGNATASYVLSGKDLEEKLAFQFEAEGQNARPQVAMSVRPGSASSIKLNVQAARRWIGSTQPYIFNVQAAPYDSQSAQAETVNLRGGQIGQAPGQTPVEAFNAQQAAYGSNKVVEAEGQFNHQTVFPVWMVTLMTAAVIGLGALLALIPGFSEPMVAITKTNPAHPQVGQSFTIYYEAKNADHVKLKGLDQEIDLDVSKKEYPLEGGLSQDARIYLRATAKNGRSIDSQGFNISLVPVPDEAKGLPRIMEFSAWMGNQSRGSRLSVKQGEELTLRWKVSNAERVEIEPIGTVKG